jgi:hypothetical protein
MEGSTFEDIASMPCQEFRVGAQIGPLRDKQPLIPAEEAVNRIRNPIFREEQPVIVIH